MASCLALCQDTTFQYPAEKLQELWRCRHIYYSQRNEKHCICFTVFTAKVWGGVFFSPQASPSKPVPRRDPRLLYRDGCGGCSPVLWRYRFFFTCWFYLKLWDCFLFPKNKNTSLNIFQISAVTVLVCCVMPFESWGQRAPLLACSTLCRGSVMRSSRRKMAPVTLVLVCYILYVYEKHKLSLHVDSSLPHTSSAALVRVPSVGLAPVKDTQPVTPVSVTVQVRTSKTVHNTLSAELNCTPTWWRDTSDMEG